MKNNKFLSGYQFMQMAELSIFSTYDPEKWHDTGDYILINQQPTINDIAKIQDSHVIFIKRDFLPFFLKTYYDILQKGVVLITHCSDIPVLNRDKWILDLPKISKWYAINTYIKHDKLVTIPIGMTTPDKTHGNMELLQEIIDKQHEKKQLVYANFDVSTNSQQRQPIANLLEMHGYPVMTGKNELGQQEYWEQLVKSKFVVSPVGNGIDCHRIWESIYLGTIPIVKRHSALESFEYNNSKLPILFIDDWEIITDEFLEKEHNRILKLSITNNIDTQIAYYDYWDAHIKKSSNKSTRTTNPQYFEFNVI